MRGRYTRILCSAMLSFEALVMLLSILVLNGFSSVSVPLAAGIGSGMAVACMVAVAGLGRPWGYPFGHALQALMVAMGLLSTPILLIGALFAALWITAYLIGLKIDRERALR